jgi:hypothetical protein
MELKDYFDCGYARISNNCPYDSFVQSDCSLMDCKFDCCFFEFVDCKDCKFFSCQYCLNRGSDCALCCRDDLRSVLDNQF